ncbi:TPA: hypothetical protein RQN15_002190 [Aeromonas hydrophila]|nr:hypothetical protein [Aeromonas hydrophila]
MAENKTSFNSQTAVIAGQKSGEVRREKKRLREVYQHAFTNKADELVKQFLGGSNEILNSKIPNEVRARMVEQIVTQVVTAQLVAAVKQDSELTMLEAKIDAKSRESLPVEADETGEYMTTTELMGREGTQAEAASLQDMCFGDWYNDQTEKRQAEIMLDCFNDSESEFFNYFSLPAKDVLTRFKVGV